MKIKYGNKKKKNNRQNLEKNWKWKENRTSADLRGTFFPLVWGTFRELFLLSDRNFASSSRELLFPSLRNGRTESSGLKNKNIRGRIKWTVRYKHRTETKSNAEKNAVGIKRVNEGKKKKNRRWRWRWRWKEEECSSECSPECSSPDSHRWHQSISCFIHFTVTVTVRITIRAFKYSVRNIPSIILRNIPWSIRNIPSTYWSF